MVPSPQTVHELFRAQVARTPEALAVIDGETVLTYAQLEDQASRLAGHLRTLGVGRDESVGVYMNRSADFVVACMAAIEAGGAYIPLDLAYPKSLLGKVLAQTESPVVVTQAALAAGLSEEFPGAVLSLDTDRAWTEATPVPVDVAADDLCFLVYTSGTTGEPKGIAMPHRGAVHSYNQRHEFSPYAVGDRVACNVFFVWEFFRPLARGGTVLPIPEVTLADPVALAKFLSSGGVTEMLFTPSLLETFLASAPPELRSAAFASMKTVWLNGEVVTAKLRTRALDELPPETRLLNTYSISECHDVANSDLRVTAPPPGGRTCLVGTPVPGVLTRIQDSAGSPMAPGQVGELLVGGPGLARGYLKRPDLTSSRFPLVEGERMYRTGDLAVRHPDGVLEIRGRCDFMVKIRGYSVHLPAVEAALRDLPGVDGCAALADGEEGSDKRLVAYVVPAADAEWSVDPVTGACPALRRGLESRLPAWSLPSVFVALERLPLSETTGKLAPKLLPDAPRHSEAPASALAALPEDATPEARAGAVRELYARILGFPPAAISDTSDFFDLGGHSLNAVALASHAGRVLGTRVEVAHVFEAPTPQRLLERVHSKDAAAPAEHLADAVLDPKVRPTSGQTPTPLSQAKAVFLTGATGFFGASLLHELLESTEAQVLCLARAADDASAHARVLENLARFGLPAPQDPSRIVGIAGDLTRHRFGLTRARFLSLAGEVDLIFHCAAAVHFVQPYQALKAATVNGTHEVLRLASLGTATPLHYVSTNGIQPATAAKPLPENGEIDDLGEQIEGGYGQSKWVAERLVWQAAKRGLPVLVVRPGNLGHHSRSGAANPSDLQYHMLEAVLRLGAAPEGLPWDVELTPVDYLATTMVRLAEDPQYYGRAFNVVHPEPVSPDRIVTALKKRAWLRGTAPRDEWLAHLKAEVETGAPDLGVLAHTFEHLEAYLGGGRFEDAGFRAAADALKLPRPETDWAYLEVYLQRREEA